MIENPFYTHEHHGDYDLIGIGRLDLEEGGSIPDCHLAVTTWGELNEARDNAILITTWFSGRCRRGLEAKDPRNRGNVRLHMVSFVGLHAIGWIISM